MKLGHSSLSLAVQDLEASREFYEKLGFVAAGGNAEENWLILKNGTCTIGLFQGMFDANIMTFNPGWDAKSQKVDDFTDIRDLQTELKRRGVELDSEVDPSTNGPASFMVRDPDGNLILVDQHV
ncbi:MAG: VOC family protein [Polyangiales bacterium]